MKILSVFDFDNTLVTTDSRIIVKRAGEVVDRITPDELLRNNRSPYVYDLDFSEFNEVTNPKKTSLFNVFIDHCNQSLCDVIILTARSKQSNESIAKLIEENGIEPSEVTIVALDSSDPRDKAQWIENRIKKERYDRVCYWEDSDLHREEVKKIMELNKGSCPSYSIFDSKVAKH